MEMGQQEAEAESRCRLTSSESETKLADVDLVALIRCRRVDERSKMRDHRVEDDELDLGHSAEQRLELLDLGFIGRLLSARSD